MSARPQPSKSDLPSRRRRKKQRTRGEIFDAATRLFDARGFDAATIEQICREADVARGTFFLHFPSKASLLFEFNRRLASDLRERLRDPRGSAVSEYRTMVDHFGERWLRQSDVMAAMLRELLAHPVPSDESQPGALDLRDVVESIVRRGQERGEFRRNVSPRLAATLFLTTCAAILSGTVYAEGEATPEEIRNQLLHVVLHGLLEPKPRLKWRPTAPEASP